MPTDPLDLVDPVRLVLLLLPEPWRVPVGAALTLAAASQTVAASIVSRLPLAAREHPRWGWAVRALGWWSVLRFRDERGTTKLPGEPPAPRVTVAPDAPEAAPLSVVAEKAGAVAVFDSRPTMAPPAPIAPTPLRAVTLTGVAAADATQAQYESARQFREQALPFDATARQEIAADVVAEAQRLTAAPLPLVHTAASALHGARWEPVTDPNDPPKEPA